MTYRRTRKYDAARLEAMRRGKEAARLARPARGVAEGVGLTC